MTTHGAERPLVHGRSMIGISIALKHSCVKGWNDKCRLSDFDHAKDVKSPLARKVDVDADKAMFVNSNRISELFLGYMTAHAFRSTFVNEYVRNKRVITVASSMNDALTDWSFDDKEIISSIIDGVENGRFDTRYYDEKSTKYHAAARRLLVKGISQADIDDVQRGRLAKIMRKVGMGNKELDEMYKNRNIQLDRARFDASCDVNARLGNDIKQCPVTATSIHARLVKGLSSWDAAFMRPVPAYLGRFRNVKDLSVNKSSINTMANLDAMKDLESLDLSENKIIKIQGMENLGNLRELRLDKNSIQDLAGVEKNWNLEKLSVNGNELKGRIKLSPLAGLDKIEELDVSNNGIESIDIGNATFPSLKRMNISYNRLNMQNGSNIINFVKNIPSLEWINIIGNYFSDEERVDMQQAILAGTAPRKIDVITKEEINPRDVSRNNG